MKFKLLFLFTFFASNLFAQIHMADSTAQAIGYWSIGDKQTFNISYEKYHVKNQDTTGRSLMKYVVDVTIKDSTQNSYIIEWFYRNYSVNTDSEVVRKITKSAENISVLIKTDEFGAIQEVVNWEQVRDYMDKTMNGIKKELSKIPGADKIIDQARLTYSSKAGIEANAIKDALQFYTFHGGKYTLHQEVTGQVQFANNFGGPPFDADTSLTLEELNEEDDNFVIRMYNSINSDQLTKATYEYLAKIGMLGNNKPKPEELPRLTSETWTASRIHGSSGWTTYSIETKEIKAEGDGVINVEERVIQIL